MENVVVKVSIAIASLTLTACGYNAHFDDCVVTCSPSNECPSGLTCTGGLCSASGACVIGLNEDALTDGMTDPDTSASNDGGCVDQNDEDGDGLGDKCDPCPISMNNVDTDNDGVGDDCDPNPAVPGDKILFFAGFAGSVIPPELTPLPSGNWTIDSGDLIATGTANVGTSLTIAAPTSKHETVTASFTVSAVSSPPAGQTIGVVDDFSHTGGTGASDEQGVDCGLYSEAPQPSLHLSNIDGTPLSTPAYEMTVGDTYVVSESRNGTAFDCSAKRSAPSPVTTMEGSGSSALDIVSPKIGLRVLGAATAHYQWIMIVASP